MTKILIVDDSEYMREVIKDILEKNSFTDNLEAKTGTEALQLFDKEHPDIVLLDIIMPDSDGLVVMKSLIPKGANVIVVSAVGQDTVIKQAKQLGAKGYLVKPFDEEQVISEIKKLSGQPS